MISGGSRNDFGGISTGFREDLDMISGGSREDFGRTSRGFRVDLNRISGGSRQHFGRISAGSRQILPAFLSSSGANGRPQFYQLLFQKSNVKMNMFK